MKKKSLLIVLLLLMLSLSLVACKKKKTPGPESGTYYFYEGSVKNTITLKEVNKFDFSLNGESKNGTYKLTESGQLTLTFSGSKNTPTSGTLIENTMSITYNGETLVFLKEIYFTVTFDTNGGSTVLSQEIINGQLAAEPQKPTKSNHTFMGWCTDNGTFLQQFAFSTQRITKPITIYAFFVQNSNQAEYTVGFDLNYENKTLPDMETINGKVYYLPTPERANNTFKGWWISQYNTSDWRSGDPARLSFEYTNGYEFKESTTLIALWQPTSTGKLDNPIITVSDTGISWIGVASGASYAIEITKPDLTKVTNSQQGTTYAHTFAEGDYVITVTANPGQSNSSTSTIYYKHKALPRVSLFAIDGYEFSFNRVANATSYTVSVNGGEADPVDASGTAARLTYDFSAYEMQPEGIKFLVTASATGFTSSQSRFVHYQILDKINKDSFNVDAEQVLTWDPIAHATDYVVNIAYNSITERKTVKTASIALKSYPKAALAISVYPTARGYNPSEAVTYNYTKEAHATPANLRIEGLKIKWDGVTGRTGYKVEIDGVEYPKTGTLTDTELEIPSDLVITAPIEIKVRTLGDNNNQHSPWSEAITISPSLTKLDYTRNEATWNYVYGAAKYRISLDGTNWTEVSVNHSSVTFNRAGAHTISVSYFDGTDWSTPITKDVTAYALTLNANGGRYNDESSTKTLHYAQDDVITFPQPARTGHDLQGWYRAAGTSQEYTDETFIGTAALTLYAHWTLMHTTVTYNYGDTGKTGDDGSIVLYYNQSYTLEVPRDNGGSGEVFIGWYKTEDDGSETRLTDELGQSINPWTTTETGAMTINAYWEKILSYDEIKGGVNNGTYSVYKNKLKENVLNDITNLKIPSTYNGALVTEIIGSAFKASTYLKHVELPNTIREVSRNAFDDCKNLVSFGVYTANDQVEDVYVALSGLLFQNVYEDGNWAGYRFACFPLGRVSSNFVIPEEIDTIGNMMFENSFGINKVTVHANIVSIGAYAFQNSSITEIEFLKEDGDCVLTTIGAGAFKNSALTGIEIPKSVRDTFVIEEGEEVRVPGIGFAAFAGCSKLNKVDFEPGSYDDLSIGSAAVDDVTGGAFYATNALRTITIPARVILIGNLAFRYSGNTGTNTGLGTITFESPKNTQTPKPLVIGVNAFENCQNLLSVRIPARTTEIQTRAFNVCTKLATLTFEDEGTEDLIIGGAGYETGGGKGPSYFGSTFSSCAFTTVKIPERVTFIGRYTFSSNSKLETVTFDAGNRGLVIEDGVFAGCGTLGAHLVSSNPNVYTYTLVSIPARATSVGRDIFSGCTLLKDVLFEKGTGEIDVSGVSTGGGFFNGCSGLETITISPSIIGLSYNVFISCTKLNSFKLLEGVNASEYTNYYVEDGVLFSSDKKTLMCYPQLKTGAAYAIPALVEIIATGAFYSNTGSRALTSITIPSTITTIEERAFIVGTASGASKLITVTFEGAVTVGASAFYGLTSITTINFGASGSTATGDLYLGKSAFQGCTGLTTFNFNADNLNIHIGESAFQGCSTSGSRAVTIGKGVVEIGESAFRGCTSFTSVSFASGSRLTSVGAYAFRDCTNLTTFQIPQNVETFDASVIMNTKVASISVDPNNDYFTSDSSGVLYTTDGTGLVYCPGAKDGSYEIPDEVTTIMKSAFRNSKLTTVTFESGSQLETIDEYAFAGAAITSIQIPANVIHINANAFQNSTIATLTFLGGAASSLETIGANAFQNTLITTVIIPKNVTDIGDYAFAANGKLTGVTFADGSVLETIGAYAFQGTAITSIVLPSVLETIGNYAFQGLGITSVNIPSTLETIGNYAFQGTKITSITIPSTLTYIGTAAFAGCTMLEEVLFTASTASEPAELELGAGTSATTGVFAGCTALATADLTNSRIKVIPGYAFYNCTALADLTIPSTVTNINTAAFYAVGKSVTEAVTLTFEGGTGELTIAAGTATTGVFADSGITTVTLSERLTAISSYMFNKCVRLEGIAIPATVLSIGTLAFYGCTLLSDVTFAARTDTLAISDGGTVAGDGFITPYSYGGTFGSTAITEINLEAAKITAIPTYIFSGCTQLQSITISATVKSIGAGAFSGCTSLSDLDIKNRVGELTIAEGTSAASGVFANTAITSIDLYVIAMTTVPAYAFYGCALLAEMSIPSNITAIGAYAFYGCALQSVNIPAKVVTIGTGAFNGCTDLEELTFGARLESGQLVITAGTSATSGAFGNTGLSGTLDLSRSGLTTIANYTFYGCTALTGVTLPTTVTTIGDFAFTYCGLTSLTVGQDITSIGKNAFQYCNDLETVEFTGVPKIDTIGAAAFAYSGIESITIPKTVTTLGGVTSSTAINNTTATSANTNVFQGCANLTEILVNSENATFISVDGVLFTKSGMLLSYPAGRTIAAGANNAEGEYKIPNTYNGGASTATVIAAGAFQDVKVLNKVFIPLNILYIHAQAFRGTTNLKDIEFEPFTATALFAANSAGASTTTNPKVLAMAAGATSPTIGGVFSDSGIAGSLTGVGTARKLDLTYSRITTIGTYAFYNCTSLTSIVIPTYTVAAADVISINDSAFLKCSALASVEFANPATGTTASGITIGSGSSTNGVFGQTASLQTITFPSNRALTLTTTTTAGFQFSGSAVQTINIPANSTIANVVAFANAPGLKSINIVTDSSVSQATKDAATFATDDGILYKKKSGTETGSTLMFYPAGRIATAFTVPSTITLTGGTTETVTIIGANAFDIYAGQSITGSTGNTTLTSITLPDTIKTVNAGAFRYCVSLTTINFTTSLTGVLNTAFGINHTIFEYCGNLTTFITSGTVVETGADRSFFAKSVDGVTFGYYNAGTAAAPVWHFALTRYPVGKKTVNGEYTIPYRVNLGTNENEDWRIVTAIASTAFTDCTYLTKINIPASIEYIGVGAFVCNTAGYASNLETVYFMTFEETYGREAGQGEEKELTFFGGTGTQPASSPAFYNCSKLTTVNIPARLTTLSVNLFRKCTSLKSVVIPTTVTTIDASGAAYGPFYECSANLTVYAVAAERPSGWTQYWNSLTGTGTSPTAYVSVVWGYHVEA